MLGIIELYLKNTRKNMKKIFFIFTMLFMAVISTLAEESTEPSTFYTWDGTTYGDGHFTITATEYDDVEWGVCLHNGNTITIKSKNGEKITKVEFKIGLGNYGLGDYDRLIFATPGDVSLSDRTIYDVNATSMVISSNVECGDYDWEYFLEIEKIVVYYELGNNGVSDEGVSDEYVLTESFANGGNYLGDNVKVEGNSNGLYIGDGKTVNISPNNDKDVRIFKVDLEFSNDFNGTINSPAGSSVEGSGTNWTISNFYSSNLEISGSNGSGQISNITVYYVKMSDEKSVTIATTDGTEYIEANGRINVTGTESAGKYGLVIDKAYPLRTIQNSVTITSYNGGEISKVELHLSNYYGPLPIKSTAGTVTKENDNEWTISNINSSSLEISHLGDGGSDGEGIVQIDNITVYYKEPIINSTMEVAANYADGFYWTTFYSYASNYQAPEGTQVFQVNLDGTKVTMIPIEDGIVNRCQGVVLKSNTGNITMEKTDDESTDSYAYNSLWGTSSEITNPSPGNVYGLSYKSSAGVAFYKLKSTGTIGANKAYLKVNSNASAHEFFTFDIDETATGVDSINAQENEENVDVKIYDLQGRRVANPGKGIYIVNGKKVLMK